MKNKKAIVWTLMLVSVIVCSICAYRYADKTCREYLDTPLSVQVIKDQLLSMTEGASLPKGNWSYGVDISHHQPLVFWKNLKVFTDQNGRTVWNKKNAVKDIQIDYVIMKASEGATFKDWRFKGRWKKADKFSYKRGSYHFFRPGKDAESQARNFINQVADIGPEDFPPILDIEKTDGLSAEAINRRALEWLQIIEKHYGRKPIIYANPHYLHNILSREITQNYPIWVANYEVSRPKMSPPLGLYTIAAMFRDQYDVVIENENVRAVDMTDCPDIVGISVNVDSLPRSLEIADTYLSRGVPVVLGGILPTTAPDEIPEKEGLIICIGAAEGTWPGIMEDLQKVTLKRIYTCPHSFSGDKIVPPAYDLMPKGDYLYRNIFHTSRGCPFRCDFCYNSSKERWYVNRPVEDVISEVRASGIKHVMFIDDNFIGNLKWTRELMAELKKSGIHWNAAVSINVVNIPGLLDEMKDSGCKGLFIGFESINPSSVSGVHKVQNDVSKYEYAVEEIHKRGIMINASFVFGLDSDTKETFQATLDWIVRNRIETVTSHILTPYPGTALHKQMESEGRLLTRDLGLYDTAHVVMQPKNMTPDELYAGYLWIYDQVYSFKNIMRRMPRSLSQVPAYLMFNFLYRKWGRFTDWLCGKVTYERIGRWGEKLSRYI